MVVTIWNDTGGDLNYEVWGPALFLGALGKHGWKCRKRDKIGPNKILQMSKYPRDITFYGGYRGSASKVTVKSHELYGHALPEQKDYEWSVGYCDDHMIQRLKPQIESIVKDDRFDVEPDEDDEDREQRRKFTEDVFPGMVYIFGEYLDVAAGCEDEANALVARPGRPEKDVKVVEREVIKYVEPEELPRESPVEVLVDHMQHKLMSPEMLDISKVAIGFDSWKVASKSMKRELKIQHVTGIAGCCGIHIDRYGRYPKTRDAIFEEADSKGVMKVLKEILPDAIAAMEAGGSSSSHAVVGTKRKERAS